MQAIPHRVAFAIGPDTRPFPFFLLSFLSINFIAYQKPLITHQREKREPSRVPTPRRINNTVRFSTPTEGHELTTHRPAVFCVWHNRHQKSPDTRLCWAAARSQGNGDDDVIISLRPARSACVRCAVHGNRQPISFSLFEFNWNSFAVKPLWTAPKYLTCINLHIHIEINQNQPFAGLYSAHAFIMLYSSASVRR